MWKNKYYTYLVAALALLILLIVILLFIGDHNRKKEEQTAPPATTSQTQQPSPAASSSPQEWWNERPPEQDYPVRVNRVQLSDNCLYKELRLGPSTRPAPGSTWAFVEFQMQNNGKEPVFAGADRVYDNQGREFLPADGYQSSTDEVGPNQTLKGIFVFDVPEGQDLASMTVNVVPAGSTDAIAVPTVRF